MKFKIPFSPPGHHRGVQLRRLLAAALVVAAAATAVSSRITGDPTVVVFAHDLPVGTEVSETDLRVSRYPADLIPEEAVLDSQEIVGRVVVSGVGTGEVVTESRLTGPRLTEALTSSFPPDQRPVVVPVRLADPATAALLRHGDTVSIVSPSDLSAPEPSPGAVVATGGRVVIADPANPETILVALEALQAQNVASASLSTPLGVVVTGS